MQLFDFDTIENYSELTPCVKGHAPIRCRLRKDGKKGEAIFSGEICRGCALVPVGCVPCLYSRISADEP